MKKDGLLYVLLVSATICTVGCYKETVVLPAGGMSAMINNTEWTAIYYRGMIDTYSSTQVELTIFGRDDSDSRVLITLPFYSDTVHTYTLDGVNNNGSYSNRYTNGTGTYTGVVVISPQSSPDSIKGTFSFTENGYYVTSGQFNVPLR